MDFTFELDIIAQFNCKVYTFDCTVGKSPDTPKTIQFYPWCIGRKDEIKPISSDLGHQGELGQYYTFSTIMRRLGHSSVDLLKMDIERHEFAVVDTLSGFFGSLPRQIAFETHLHNAYGMWGRPVLEKEWAALWETLSELKYSVFAHEPNPLCTCCCEFSLVRRD